MSEGKTPVEIVLAGLMARPERLDAFDFSDSMFSGRAKDGFGLICTEWENHRPERINPLLLKAAGHDGVGEYLAELQGWEPIGDEDFRLYYIRFREPGLKKSIARKLEAWIKSPAGVELASVRPELEELDRLKQNGAMSSHPTTIFLSEVEPRTVPWLWPNFIPRGRGTLISGDPGSAKTWFALDMAARLSRGLPWADGSPGCEPANTYYMSVEDDAHDTLRPRIDSLGGDPSKIAIYNAEHPLHLDLSTETGLLRIEREIIQVGNVRLVVVDPILDFSGGVNPNAGEEVRGLLVPLVNMAARYDFALVMIGHLNKAQALNAIYRAGGSTSGWLGKCRASFMVFRDLDDKVLRHFVPIKANLAPQDPPQIEFRISAGRLNAHTSTEEVNVDEHLNPQRGPEPRERQAAAEWLENLFSSRNEIPATEIYDAAQKHGLSEATLRRAKTSGRYKSLRRKILGLDDVWVWLKP